VNRFLKLTHFLLRGPRSRYVGFPYITTRLWKPALRPAIAYYPSAPDRLREALVRAGFTAGALREACQVWARSSGIIRLELCTLFDPDVPLFFPGKGAPI
jgi:hypothetical protein